MKRVLLICAKLSIGGAEKVVRDIGLGADPDEFEIHYIVFGNETEVYEKPLLDHGCKVFHLALPSENHIRYLQSLKRLIRDYHYDIIHAHTMFSSAWAMLAGKQLGVPVRITHSHSVLGPQKRGFLNKMYEEMMRRSILACATHYVACGQRAGERLYGEGAFKRKGLVILNGIDTSVFTYNVQARRELRSSLGLNNRFVIGHVGHLAAVKNQAFLIGLMPEILQIRPDALLLLLGEGSDRPVLKDNLSRLRLHGHVILTGNVTDVQRYLSAMDVFAFPSLFEGMPLSVIEAQANGLPCVLSDKVPPDVYLTDLVKVLPLDDPKAWTDALCGSQRNDPMRYAEQMKNSGFDTLNMQKRIYCLYREER